MKRVVQVVVVVALLSSAHRLPAPILENPESTPTPKHEAIVRTKLKPKATAQPNESPKSAAKPIARKRFAGVWIGTIPAFPTGPQETRLTIDPNETTILQEWLKHPPSHTAKAEISGDTIHATFRTGITFTWSLTPLADGTSAQARLQAFMNDNTAIFRRVVSEPVR
jgi:hypothetical protein